MRKQLYMAIANRLLAITDNEDNTLIKYVDLWNRNVEFIETDGVFPMPAVFVEFDTINWEKSPTGRQRALVNINLHVVTKIIKKTHAEAETLSDNLNFLDLMDTICSTLTAVGGPGFSAFSRVASTTNHDHNEVMDNVETYQTMVIDDSASV